MVSNKTVPEGFNLKFRSKFNPGFTNHSSLHCAVQKTFYGFKKKGDHKARDTQFYFQNI